MNNLFTEPTLYKSKYSWYIQYYIQPVGSPIRERVRIYKGINKGTDAERTEKAQAIIAELKRKIATGTMKEARTIENVLVPTAEKSFSPQITVTTAAKDTIVALNDYLDQVKLRVVFRSWQTYKSILYKFSIFLQTEYKGIYYTYLTRKHLIEYLTALARSGLSRTTIKKNTQVLHNFFKWLYENEKIAQNIAVNLPSNFGVIKDNAPRPLSKDDIKKFKSVIYDVDKQLWLACMFQYYAAIRPAELRAIRLRDIDIDHKHIILHAEQTKNKKNDIVRLHTALLILTI